MTNVSGNRKNLRFLGRSRNATHERNPCFGQRKSNRQATHRQPPSNRQATAKQRRREPLPLPRDSSKEESRQNNREDRTEKTEERRQNSGEAESQYDSMIVMTVYCNDCMVVRTVGLKLEGQYDRTLSPQGLTRRSACGLANCANTATMVSIDG